MSSKKKNRKQNVLVTADVPSVESITRKNSFRGILLAAKNDGQKQAIKTIIDNDISFLYGYPGTGKTAIAVGIGLQGLLSGKYQKLILTRPYVEAGEHLGFLKGDFMNKIAPFMFPITEIISQFLGTSVATELIDNGNITVMPMAYLRGTTFTNSFIVADEVQNTSPSQMRMLLTRMGEGSKMVVTGDTEQSDIIGKNGLTDAITRLKDISGIGWHELTEECCVRLPIVVAIEKKYRK